jgi:uncharacterized integral membrane protein
MGGMANKDPRTADQSTPTPAADKGSKGTRKTDAAAGTKQPAPAPAGNDRPNKVQGSVAGSTWVALIIGAIILILLLVFILQNMDSVRLQLFIWQWNFPIGVGMLIAAVGGGLVMASVGVVRIIQLRRQVGQ